ncbi:hypothetical protein JGS39_39455 [Streptomyces sp. P01-B04]|uniref:hypothetical protein n=1 Tax=Streptomyces poriferorum TaxID=2798799 RepID=UPI001C5F1A2A|nr:hypothetical protein [Streptomyces poriferorum]MBW5254954.1 hypothetical protein [Streptomyces poriferorum]MBW5262768.1 hypothetical protein [Streptomyces poriferorum]
MNQRTRLKRAVLRDRRRGYDDGPALIGPMTGFDLYLTKIYSPLAALAQIHHMVTHPEETRAYISAAQQAVAEALRAARGSDREAEA